MTMSKTEKMRKLFAEKQLDTEQMDGVAGGSADEKADDSRFLNVLLRGHPCQPERYGETRVGGYESSSITDELVRAWGSVGIEAKIFTISSNMYVDNATGKEITRNEVFALAQQRVGKQLQHSDWYWPDD